VLFYRPEPFTVVVRPFLSIVKDAVYGNWERVQRAVDSEEFELGSFQQFLFNHHLAGQFYLLVVHSPAATSFPVKFLDAIYGKYCSQRERNEKLLENTRDLKTIFDKHKISFVVLKGVYFAHRFYGNIDQRFMWDMDILVKQEDVKRAITTLLASGYQKNAGIITNNTFTRRFVHAVGLHRNGIELDLHWLIRYRPAFHIDYDKIWSTLRPYTLYDMSVNVLGDEYNLLTVVLGIATDLEQGKSRLKHFCDLIFLLRELDHEFDWELFFDHREDERTTKVCVNVLGIFLLLFNARSYYHNLARVIEERSNLLCFQEPEEAFRLINGARQNFRNRRWFSRIYPGGPWRYALWWTLTAPLRYALNRNI